ncbi:MULTISPECIES: RNA polymerase sigma factor [Flavobacterium]|jgi:RNA polymerase sigma factor (sigma-70 family)|uniref:RNA polymerase ECF family sigma subunit n=1 Tax=Flavobacterium lindanitolerans TaxID=428988 RepID=A0A497URL0_9FLAO|nr:MULTISPECIES: RNA polymerase sigma factor [Flavobacterium]KQS53210.1 RNA polymerase [Flavobacterium sp. Leaf359]PKW21176.1 RNA polymerase ECF family sigma subunit [Flavobacterium lindanitolerans]RLJ30186.1 RNA polymerase sigma-70 factor (ECF subfamily) [Flavobacterium lindanitolerans]THD30087.1 MAG: RNA polymerase sigma factor [Flavobacterium johnsoniae]
MALPNDQFYIDRIMKGDTQAFTHLVERYKTLVYTLALRMIKNTEEAEEAAQDTFVKVFRSMEKFKGESKFSTWIYRVAYNTCLDRIKKHKTVPLTVDIDNYGSRQLAAAENVLDAMDGEERHRAIQECLQQLPGEDAFLLTLYYFEEQSLEEIAKIIGIKANNVKIKLFRCRKKLGEIVRARLEPEIISEYERERK